MAHRPNLQLVIAGVAVRFRCASEAELGRLVDFLSKAFVVSRADERCAVALDFDLAAHGPAPALAPDAVEISRSRSLGVWRCGAGFVLHLGTSHLRLDLTEGRACGGLGPDFDALPFADRREFFLLSFLMTLRRARVFGLHANAVVRGGSCAVITAASGCGKTTLTLSLVSRGFGYVGDDAIVLADSSDGAKLELRALRGGFSCTPETMAMFPQLGRGKPEALGSPEPKWLVCAERAFPGLAHSVCVPNLLLLPRLAAHGDDPQRTQIRPVAAPVAFMALYQQSPGIRSGLADVAVQVEGLRKLVEQCRSYEIIQGRDVLQTPESVAQRVESLPRWEPGQHG